eukprot:PhF_6_TR14240/c3_g2_i3/m.22847
MGSSCSTSVQVVKDRKSTFSCVVTGSQDEIETPPGSFNSSTRHEYSNSNGLTNPEPSAEEEEGVNSEDYNNDDDDDDATADVFFFFAAITSAWSRTIEAVASARRVTSWSMVIKAQVSMG